jgi:hypothetical protein
MHHHMMIFAKADICPQDGEGAAPPDCHRRAAAAEII